MLRNHILSLVFGFVLTKWCQETIIICWVQKKYIWNGAARPGYRRTYFSTLLLRSLLCLSHTTSFYRTCLILFFSNFIYTTKIVRPGEDTKLNFKTNFSFLNSKSWMSSAGRTIFLVYIKLRKILWDQSCIRMWYQQTEKRLI